MANKMLIDASHPEETRVVVLRGNRIEEFDFEAASKKQLRGNIYLAKVTRVEPSLQAAFIEYGGNRHGFLAFSEIHPDYYQIPVADRQALLDEEARSQDDEEEESRSASNRRSRRHRRGNGQPSADKRTSSADEAISERFEPDEASPASDESSPASDEDAGHPIDPAHEQTDEPDAVVAEETAAEPGSDEPVDPGSGREAESAPVSHEPSPAAEAPVDAAPDAVDEAPQPDDAAQDHEADAEPADARDTDDHQQDDHEGVTTLEHGYEATSDRSDPGEETTSRDRSAEQAAEDDAVEQIGGDALEDVPHRVARPRRHYKIQEVIKRRQVLLVQVVKEERGNKGAALTTYLSLAGRYSVLMPNTARGGGISRKITDAEDRKRLKSIAQELEVPDGMGIILRTAGAARGMPEVKRDFEYLMRMWETVRELTLKSSAPTLVYEEGSLIKRSIRDLYNKDVDEVIVAGDDGYKEARDFMRLLMPSHTKNVIAYRDPQPIFAKAGAEAQLDAMFSNHVTLKSGGYLVINQTEALVAIDVNSGRSTREHNIEDTALRTNLEAADEVARQLRLRDLAGLIVVDFIDMEEGRNDRAVERRIKDALKNDRARIQIGRISHFGLLEMSRQRMRTGVLEGSTVMCPHCAGAGMVRSISSIALHVLRLLEDSLIKAATHNLSVRTRTEVALYILNQKRMNLLDLETRFGVTVSVFADPLMTGAVYHAIEHGSEATPPTGLTYRAAGSRAEAPAVVDEDEIEADVPDMADEDEAVEDAAEPRPVMARESRGRDGHGRESRPREGAREGQGRRDAASGEAEGEGSRRRKRRRRRRGRDGQAYQPGSDAGANQAADSLGETDGDALGDEPGSATGFDLAEGGDAVQVDLFGAEPLPATAEPTVADGDEEAGAAEDVAEAPRRRRVRRAPRGSEAAAATEGAPATEETGVPAKRPRRSRARAAEVVAEVADSEALQPPADPDSEADTAKTHPVEASPAAAGPAEAAPAPATAPRSAEPAPLAQPDPDRPKRSGWWQRAKATFSTGS